MPIGDASLAVGKARFTSRPLFTSIESQPALSVNPIERWHIVSSPDVDDAHLWDLCHAIREQGFGLAGTAVPTFAEPNLRQQFLVGDTAEQALGLVGGCIATPQNVAYPTDPDLRWYVDAQHVDIGTPAGGGGVRIAHLDTGYDPKHLSVPRFVEKAREHNFVDAAFPNDATDRTTTGVLSNLGHRTGTLSILAGSAIPGAAIPSPGVAPDANIVPVRVANSVVLFENAAIAQAFDYVHQLCQSGPGSFVDIITMSMGGLASQAWADAANALYDLGVFIVTAAGNNYGNLPTRNIVYPARFRRVVAACGVMANGQPYANLDRKLMAGNYGPASKMETAVAAYTPNVPWARIGCSDILNWDGNGTSSATPQVAAAGARWLAKNRAAVDAYPQGWMRVEAIRSALFQSARNAANSTFLGKGTIDADAALTILPPSAASLKSQPQDVVAFPLLRLLTGLGIVPAVTPQDRMLELEALQLSQSRAIEDLLPDPEDTSSVTVSQSRAIADALASDPRASDTLRRALGAAGPRTFSMPQASTSIVQPTAPPATVAVSPHDAFRIAHAVNPPIPSPEYRTLRIFAYDPSLESDLKTLNLTEGVIRVRWEPLAPGPGGEYIEVVDIDPASGAAYAPIDLDHPALLAQDGRPPAEGAVSPADGLRGRDEDHRALRTCTWPGGAVGRSHQ